MSLAETRSALEALLDSRLGGLRDGPISSELRASAAAAFRGSELQLERDEAWRFTDLRALARLGASALRNDARAEARRANAVSPELPAWLADGELSTAPRLAFVDGRFEAALSSLQHLPSGARFVRLADEPEARSRIGSITDIKLRAFTALNTALVEDGAYVRVPDRCALETPLVVLHLSSGAQPLASPRTWIELGRESRARVVELHVGSAPGPRLVNAVSEASLHAGAQLDHVILQDQTDETVHLAELAVTQERDSRLGSHSLALGGALARTEIRTCLCGEGAHGRLHGLYLGHGSQVLDHHTTIDHAAPHTTSDELYKGILGDRAKGVFCGRVDVRPDAQKIEAQQTNRALLTSDAAAVHTRPQLEIYADDVRCSHGASIGQLDPDALFYLRARGIDEARAYALLTQAFVEDVLTSLRFSELAEGVRERLHARHVRS